MSKDYCDRKASICFDSTIKFKRIKMKNEDSEILYSHFVGQSAYLKLIKSKYDALSNFDDRLITVIAMLTSFELTINLAYVYVSIFVYNLKGINFCAGLVGFILLMISIVTTIILMSGTSYKIKVISFDLFEFVENDKIVTKKINLCIYSIIATYMLTPHN
jgi:hypothetical protein